MDIAIRLFLTLVAIGVMFGAVCFVAWVTILLVVPGWRVVGLGLRGAGWGAMSQRSEGARLRFVELSSRVAPLPHIRRVSPYEGPPT